MKCLDAGLPSPERYFAGMFKSLIASIVPILKLIECYFCHLFTHARDFIIYRYFLCSFSNVIDPRITGMLYCPKRWYC